MCLTLVPFKECGYGTCVNNTCVCDVGFVQSQEFLFRAVEPNSILYCDYSETGTVVLASLLLVLIVITFAAQVFVIENARQAKRLAFGIIGYIFTIIALSMRIARSSEALFGINFAYTFFLSFAISSLVYQFVVFLNKYIHYMLSFIDTNSYTRRFAMFSYRLNFVFLFVFKLGSILFVSTTLVESPETSGLLSRLACAIYAFSLFYLLISGTVLFTKYIHDLEIVVASSSDLNKTVMVSDSFAAKCRRQLPKVRAVRIGNFLSCAYVSAINFLALIFEGWLKRFIYILYVSFFFYTMTNLFIIRAANRVSKERITYLRKVGSKAQRKVLFGESSVSSNIPERSININSI